MISVHREIIGVDADIISSDSDSIIRDSEVCSDIDTISSDSGEVVIWVHYDITGRQGDISAIRKGIGISES